MSIFFVICAVGLLITLPLHLVSIKYGILENRLGKEKGEKANKILGQISGDGHYLFCLGIWLAPQSRFYLPAFRPMVTLSLFDYRLSLFHILLSVPLILSFVIIEASAVKSLSMETSVTHKVNRVVTEGIYAHCRHPQHLGHLLGYAGMTILFSGLASLCVFPVVIVIVLILSFAEERELVGRYGEVYLAYRRRVPFLIPGTKR